MSEKIRCALIGLGRIASTLEDDSLREKPATHAGAVTAEPETELVGGFDSDPAARELFARRWNLNRETALFDNPRLMLKELKPEILHIATHEDSHLTYLKMAVEEGIPLVILEKPLSDNLRMARKMRNRLKQTRVLINHERRYSRDYRIVKEHIRKKSYGELLSVTGRLYMGMRNSVRNILLHDGTHMLDIIPYLTGEALEGLNLRQSGKNSHTIYATAHCGDVSVLCEFGNSRDHLVFELELSFTKGRIRVGNGIYEEWESRESEFYEKMRSLSRTEREAIGKTGYFSGMIRDAVRVYRDPAARPVSSYEDGVRSLELIQFLRRKCP